MAGHSKWKNIMHKKSKTDAQRGNLFTKIGREIAVTVKAGGPDPAVNFKLADIIAKAKMNNMPGDSIARSIKKAAGGNDGVEYQDVVYEGYGPGGVAVIVEALTDNRNRTAADMRHLFDKFGGNLGQSGCVMFNFEKKGSIIIEKTDEISDDKIFEDALECGAEDVTIEQDYFEVLTDPNDFSAVRDSLEKMGYTLSEAEVSYIAQTTVKLSEQDSVKMQKLIDNMEALDDVQNIWHSLEQ